MPLRNSFVILDEPGEYIEPGEPGGMVRPLSRDQFYLLAIVQNIA
jgi:hypothetical protein